MSAPRVVGAPRDLLQIEAIGFGGVLPEIAFAGFLSLGGEVFVHQFHVARVVAAVFGAGPITAVDQTF